MLFIIATNGLRSICSKEVANISGKILYKSSIVVSSVSSKLLQKKKISITLLPLGF
jgi:hypothetical protein